MLQRPGPLCRRVLSAAVVVPFVLLWPALASAQKVKVDGNLADIEALAPVAVNDPSWDVSSFMSSGFDFSRVLVHYYPKQDTLYLALDLMDPSDGPGVPGDADGDKNPNSRTSPMVMVDQFGIGEDEYYVFEIDVDLDGNFGEYEDLRVKYRHNRLSFERGDGNPTAPGLRARVALGTRGSAVDPHVPNQNRSTEDLEISITGYANQDETPRSFAVRVRAGSTVDHLPDDTNDEPIAFAFPSVVELRTSFTDPEQRRLGDCAVAFPGDVVSVAATVTNVGSLPLQPVWMVFHFPAGLEYVSGSVGNATEGREIASPEGQIVRFVGLGGKQELAPGESATVTFDVLAVSFPTCHMTIRGYAEGVSRGDVPVCEFSCIETICLLE